MVRASSLLIFKSHPKRVCWSPDVTFLFCFSASCSLWSLQGESQLFNCRGRLYDLQSLRRRGPEEHRYRWKNSKRRLIFSIWHIGEWACCHIINSVLFLKFSLVAFAAVKALTEVELLKKATCNAVTIQNNNQYLVMGASGTEIIVDYRYKSVSLLLLLFLLILFFCWLAVLLWSLQVSPPSGLGGAGGAMAYRLHHPRVSGLRCPAGGLRSGATVSELPRIVKPRNAAEQISDQHFLNWAINGSVQRDTDKLLPFVVISYY